jgi:hypothetical protein
MASQEEAGAASPSEQAVRDGAACIHSHSVHRRAVVVMLVIERSRTQGEVLAPARVEPWLERDSAMALLCLLCQPINHPLSRHPSLDQERRSQGRS